MECPKGIMEIKTETIKAVYAYQNFMAWCFANAPEDYDPETVKRILERYDVIIKEIEQW